MSDETRRAATTGGVAEAAVSVTLGAAGLVAGAALMYFLDPQLGESRRSRMADRLAGAARRTGGRASGWTEDVTQELEAVPHDLRYRSSDEAVSDDVLAARVRSELGHIVKHAGAIDVQVTDGHVILRGPVLAEEAIGVVATVSTVPGVKTVDDRLEVRESADSIPSLQK